MGAVSVRVLTPAVSAVIDLVSENLCGNQTTRLSPVGWTCRYDDNLRITILLGNRLLGMSAVFLDWVVSGG